MEWNEIKNNEIEIKNKIKWKNEMKWKNKKMKLKKNFFRIFSGLMDWARIEQKKSDTDMLLKLGALSS